MLGREGEQRVDGRRERNVRGGGVDTARRPRTRRDLAPLWMLAGLATGLAAFFLWDFVVHGWRFPVGPDGPVYLWWMRLAGYDGLSAVPRPGVPAISLALAGTLRLSPVAVTAGLECALGVAIGMASVALVQAAGSDLATSLLAGLLAGTFAVHLAAGYLATLAFAALFLAAGAMLALPTRRATVAAAGLLGAAGLSHPLFFPLGLAILAIAAWQAFRADRAEAKRVAAAALSGGVVLGAGILALLSGSGPLAVDTSKDGFLRRAGLIGELHHAYLDRFIHRWTRYVEWASLPLAVLGLRDTGGFVGRFLRAWGITLVLGVAISLATGLAPADRFITFGFVVPILSAFGLVRLRRALRARRAIGTVLAGALAAAMIAGSAIAWIRQAPFMSELEVARSTTAAAYAAAAPSGAPLVFLVNGSGPTAAFLETRAANVIRATVPPDRIRDVVIVVPPPVTPGPVTADRAVLSRLTAADEAAALRRSGMSAITFVVAPFDRVDPATPHLVSKGVAVFPAVAGPARPVDPLRPSSPLGIVFATIAILALLAVAGFGWSRAVNDEPLVAVGTAPAFGAAALILVAIAAERLGAPLTGTAGPTLVSAVGGGGGYLVRFLLQRRAGADTAT